MRIPREADVTKLHNTCYICNKGTFRLMATSDRYWCCDHCHYIGYLKVYRTDPANQTYSPSLKKGSLMPPETETNPDNEEDSDYLENLLHRIEEIMNEINEEPTP